MFEQMEIYILIMMGAFLLGVLATREYYKRRMQQISTSQIIEYAMIEKHVSKLRSMTLLLNKLVGDIKTCSGDISEGLILSQDIEETILPHKNKDKNG